MDDVSILVDLVVGGSKRAREKYYDYAIEPYKSDTNKTVGDVKKVDKAKAIVRALASNDNKVSARGKSKAEALLRVLESQHESQL